MSSPRRIKSTILAEARAKMDPKAKARTAQRMALSVQIAEALAAKGWSKSYFAGLLGKEPSEITKWLSGTHNFTIDTLSDIQDALGITFFAGNQPVESRSVYVLAVRLPTPTKQNFVYVGTSNLPISTTNYYPFATR